MDPNVCLVEMLMLMTDYYKEKDGEQRAWIAEDIAIHVDSLQRWINMGGFMPSVEDCIWKVLTSDLYETESKRIVDAYNIAKERK